MENLFNLLLFKSIEKSRIHCLKFSILRIGFLLFLCYLNLSESHFNFSVFIFVFLST